MKGKSSMKPGVKFALCCKDEERAGISRLSACMRACCELPPALVSAFT